MRLAEGCGAIAVQPQHLRQRRHAVRALAGLPGEGGGGLRDRAHVVRMMVSTAEQRGPRRRAKRRSVELVVAQAGVGQALHRRHVDGPAEGARLAEPHVVDQHDEDVGRAGRRLDLESWRRCGIASIEHRARRGLRLRDRQHRAVGRQHHLRGRGPLGSHGRRRQWRQHQAKTQDQGDRHPHRGVLLLGLASASRADETTSGHRAQIYVTVRAPARHGEHATPRRD